MSKLCFSMRLSEAPALLVVTVTCSKFATKNELSLSRGEVLTVRFSELGMLEGSIEESKNETVRVAFEHKERTEKT